MAAIKANAKTLIQKIVESIHSMEREVEVDVQLTESRTPISEFSNWKDDYWTTNGFGLDDEAEIASAMDNFDPINELNLTFKINPSEAKQISTVLQEHKVQG